MKGKIVTFVLGLVIGSGILFLLDSKSKKSVNSKYIQLNTDYHIETIGYLKKGTILRIDEPMDEGFTRFILYLNLSDGEANLKYKTEHESEIIPYWLRQTVEETNRLNQ
jgi:hypothetical protein